MRLLLWVWCLILAGCATPLSPFLPLPAQDYPPPAPRELRGAWVATVANIDWPSRAGLPAEDQRKEMLALLDRARAIGLNAIVLQVRPAADAIYPSALEPWSEVLSGEQGRAPAPLYDPLEEWVEEAHRRGIELHAWFNPYRARHGSARSGPAPLHVSRAKPALVRSYGDLEWLDPGEAEAAAHTLAVVADVAQRYDIDAAHIDDYFYPYPLVAADGSEQAFPDDASWQRYREDGGTLMRSDWRRDNVSRLVQTMHDTLHRIKPGLRFGISPFGLPRPDERPAGIEGFSQYDKLYADVELWIDKGWFDYLAPQLYWPIERRPQAFAVLADHWAARVGKGRLLVPGLFTSSVASGVRPWAADEVLNQIELLRQRPAVGGHIHFSMAALMQDRDGVSTRLLAGPYRQAALVPASPWLDAAVPAAPMLTGANAALKIQPAAPAFVWAIWRRAAGQWRFTVQAAHALALPMDTADDAVVVSAVGRNGQESPRVGLRLR